MNKRLTKLFASPTRMARLTKSLPAAFEMAMKEMPRGNPAVGLVREHALIGYLIAEFGERNVQVPDDGTARNYDVLLHGSPLSIKTVTGNGGVKVLWTVDPVHIGREISRDYKPSCDILLVRVHWGKEVESIFYIPQEVQKKARKALGDAYLSAKVGTNHRGISISSAGMKALLADGRTLRARVGWHKKGLDHTPYERWTRYWLKPRRSPSMG